MEYITLNNGVKIPQLGYDVYQIDPPETVKYSWDGETCKTIRNGRTSLKK